MKSILTNFTSWLESADRTELTRARRLLHVLALMFWAVLILVLPAEAFELISALTLMLSAVGLLILELRDTGDA